MIAVEDTVLVLLAAGLSQRFGDAPKLHQPLLNRPLGMHAAVTLAALPFREQVAVVDDDPLSYDTLGFRMIANPDPAQGMASSLRLGVAHAKAQGASAVLVALADMPCVTATHVLRLFDAATGPDTVVASSDGHAATPPALFGRGRFEALLALEGENGARDLIRAGRHVVTDAADLVDVDTPAELARLRGMV
ncbi:nucleotidyltransferase family protein [Sphingomonas sp.]|uniref:nucleotidyltransferase family protein n=1 Tax=Sphingomonas sp. TaxID=28214 RepID=UPI003B003F86